MNDEIIIKTIRPEYAADLEQLQRDAFATLHEDELMVEAHFLKHCELFPEGNFVAFCGDRIVGLGSGFLIDFDFEDSAHTFQEIIAGGYYTNHDPEGAYYYGADISVHPDFRRRGIGTKLYEARKDIVRQLNRRGIVAGGLIPNYANYKKDMSPYDYVEQVVAGTLYDSTLSFQLKRGFKVRQLLENYIEDSASDNWSTLIVWENDSYQP